MKYRKNIHDHLFILQISDERFLMVPQFDAEDSADTTPSSQSFTISEKDQKMLQDACLTLGIGHTKEIKLAEGTKEEILCTISRKTEDTSIAHLIYTSDARAEEISKKAHTRLAELTGIVRHDIMNQITAIMGYFEIINEMIPEELVPFMEKEQTLVQNLRNITDSTRYYQVLGSKSAAWISTNDLLARYRNNPLLQSLTISGTLAGIEVFADPEFDPSIIRLLEDLMKNYPHAEITFGWEIFTKYDENNDQSLNNLKDEKYICIWISDNAGYFAGFDPRKVFYHTIIPSGPVVFCTLAEVCNLTDIIPRIRTEPICRFELLVPASSYLVMQPYV